MFIECDRAAIDSLVEKLADAHPNYEIYAGVKSLFLRLAGRKARLVYVIVARKGKKGARLTAFSKTRKSVLWTCFLR